MVPVLFPSCRTLCLHLKLRVQYDRRMGRLPCRESRTESQTSEAFVIRRGGAAERMSFRAGAEANDTQLAPTTRQTRPLDPAAARGRVCLLICPAADRRDGFPAPPERRQQRAVQDGRASLPWYASPRTRGHSDGSCCARAHLLLFSGHPNLLRPCLWQGRASSGQKKEPYKASIPALRVALYSCPAFAGQYTFMRFRSGRSCSNPYGSIIADTAGRKKHT